MTKKEILIDEDGVAIEFGSYFEWLSISREDDKLIAAAHVKGNHVHTKLKPKHVRSIARALLALADQVDPPAPVVLVDVDGHEWFEITPGAWTWGHNLKGDEGHERAQRDVERGDEDSFTNQTRAQLDNHGYAPFTLAARPA